MKTIVARGHAPMLGLPRTCCVDRSTAVRCSRTTPHRRQLQYWVSYLPCTTEVCNDVASVPQDADKTWTDGVGLVIFFGVLAVSTCVRPTGSKAPDNIPRITKQNYFHGKRGLAHATQDYSSQSPPKNGTLGTPLDRVTEPYASEEFVSISALWDEMLVRTSRALSLLPQTTLFCFCSFLKR